MSGWIPFSRVDASEREARYVAQAIATGALRGGGEFTRRCEQALSATLGRGTVLLTSSCTHALEMAAILLDVRPGDEVICPSWTFASTANAFVLRGARIVFVDVEPGTLTLDLAAVRAAITPRTVGVVPVHYAGFSCHMQELAAIAARHGLWVVEDAAQALYARAHGAPLGTFGALAAFSFHETKNLTAGGEGGALVVNDPSLLARAEMLREKGTDRERFLRGEVSRYRWCDVGSSYLVSELQAAFLLAQLERAGEIQAARLAAWSAYQEGLATLDPQRLARPAGADWSEHNAHTWFMRLRDAADRDALVDWCAARQVRVATHYEPLHASPAGLRYGEIRGSSAETDRAAAGLLRLPLWSGMTATEVARVTTTVQDFFRHHPPRAV